MKTRKVVIPAVVVLCTLLGLLAYSVFSGGGTASAAQGTQTFVLIPNVDDDDGDGLPDSAAKAVDWTKDDDLVQVRIKPTSELPEAAVLRVEISKPWDGLSRVFVRQGSSAAFRLMEAPARVSAVDAGRNLVTIAIDVADFADGGRPPAFDVKARFETKDGRPLSEEVIKCTVAPFFMSSCLDPVDAVHVTRTKLTEQFVADLEALVKTAGAQLIALADPTLPEHDIWMQDATEIGYASDGKRLMHVALHGNRGRELDDLFAKKFVGRSAAVIRRGNYREQAQWIDWYGNLEVSPPVRVGGHDYPNGRIYAGTQGVRSMHPDVIRFLEAQGVQAPVLWLDTSWLVIGHVDETVSWVPSKVGRPYRMLMPSPRLAVEILRKAAAEAPGSVVNRGTKRADDRPGESPERKVTDVLDDKKLMAAQDFVQKKIDDVRRSVQEGLGIADVDIIEIPVLFSESMPRFAGRYGAETPNMVNGLQIGTTLVVPDPHGPLVNGKDVLLQAVKDRIEPIGCKVVAIDNFYPYHQWAGEVHCGTNATRRPPVRR